MRKTAVLVLVILGVLSLANTALAWPTEIWDSTDPTVHK